MDVKFNVKKTYKVNSIEYNSIEEMPAAIREAYEKAVAGSKGKQGIITTGKIVFNGQEYENVDAMPPDIRQMYESIMKTVKSGEITATANASINIGKQAVDFRKEDALNSYSMSKPIAPQSFFSSRVIVIVAAVLGLLVGLYFLLKGVYGTP